MKYVFAFGWKGLFITLAFSGLVVGFQDCSQVQFGQATASSQSATACAKQLQAQTAPIKMLFVVDMSGSNASGDNGGPPTDPGKTMRAGSIQKFFTDYAAKANFSWGFIGFQFTSAQSFVGASGAASFGAASSMQGAIDQLKCQSDSGGTPYSAALNMTAAAIRNDPDLNSATKPIYVVVFLSDGMPNPAYPNGDAQLYGDVAAIASIAPGRVSINTVFYGADDPAAGPRLQGMATAGGGHFLNTNQYPAGMDFQISDAIYLPGLTCH